MYKIISPLQIRTSTTRQGKDKFFILNLNNYRNTYFRTLNVAKIKYKQAIVEQLEHQPRYERVGIIYQVFKGDNRRFDIGNVLAIHQKFFEDALVETGKLPDDKSSLLPIVIFEAGEVDKDNPRVEVTVYNLNNFQEGQEFMLAIEEYIAGVI